MENIVIDSSKWRGDGLVYKGPLDKSDRGCPLFSKGFFNMKSEKQSNFGFDLGRKFIILKDRILIIMIKMMTIWKN